MYEYRLAEFFLQGVGKFAERQLVRDAPLHPNRPPADLAEGLEVTHSQDPRQPVVVPDLRVRVERQVRRVEADAVV